MSASLPDLVRRITRKLEIGRGMSLSAAELDLLVTSGAYEVLQRATAYELRTAAEERVAKRENPSPSSSDAA